MPLKSPELVVSDAAAWRSWLAEHCYSDPVIWLAVSKNGATTPSLTYAEALDEALCYGWIDSGGGPRDETTRYIRFGPRKVKSAWSKRNVGYIERLEREGRIAEAGRSAVESARANGYWDAAYSAGDAPRDLMNSIEQAHVIAAWEEVSKKDRYAMFVKLGGLPIGSAAREKRVNAIVKQLLDQRPPEQMPLLATKNTVAKHRHPTKLTNTTNRSLRSSGRLAGKSSNTT